MEFETQSAAGLWTQVDPDGGYDSKPFFSIVLAAYNQGTFLEETFKSIVAQRYDRWEVILVNDGSTDDTWEVAQRLTQRFSHSRIRLITKPNGGLADARNVGLRYAKVHAPPPSLVSHPRACATCGTHAAPRLPQPPAVCVRVCVLKRVRAPALRGRFPVEVKSAGRSQGVCDVGLRLAACPSSLLVSLSPRRPSVECLSLTYRADAVLVCRRRAGQLAVHAGQRRPAREGLSAARGGLRVGGRPRGHHPGLHAKLRRRCGGTSAVCSHKLRSPERRAIRRRIELTAVRLVGLNRPPAPR